MKRLIILVEGDSEIVLMNKLIIPYLYRETADFGIGWSIESVKVIDLSSAS